MGECWVVVWRKEEEKRCLWEDGGQRSGREGECASESEKEVSRAG